MTAGDLAIVTSPAVNRPPLQSNDRRIQFAGLPCGLIRKRKLDRYPLLSSRDSRDVALARRVFDQFDVSGPHGDLFSTRHFELALAAQSNDVLAARSSVPVAHST